MDNTRRSLDRSRAPLPKKQRLTGELNTGLKFPQRQTGSALASARFQTNDRSIGGGGGRDDDEYEPQPLPHQELVAQYKTALADLTFNHKPIITNLTIIAGENVPAAKSIAGTICDNILEVPREQKLPSLYLLDSIVKNIGREYIKYFAARLPEVFCKAYREVNPSVHTSMRHLFGTWRRVFPPPTLQIIEKELGFTPAVNGSASTSATLRSDSESQRPPHSIHVNPKYLERQHLQQSNRTKGGVNDMSGAILNSNEDSERPVRVLGASRPWLDPRVNMHNNQHVRRDAFNDSDLERSIGGSFGGNEYSSGISSKSGSGVGRNGNRLIGGVAETLSSQRNGFSLKHSLSNHEASKSTNTDAHHQSRQVITDSQSSGMSGNWKNSEEEEFMWDGMNSGLTDKEQNVSSNLSTDPWMADDENLEGEDHLQVRHPFGEKVDREISTVKKQQQLGPSHTDVTLKTKKPPQFKVSAARGTSLKSTTNSLSAASVKTGIIPKKSITSSLPATSSLDARNLPSQSVVRPTRSGGPSPTALIPQGKAGQKQRDSTQPPTSSNVSSVSGLSSNSTNKNALNPIENLLSSLVAKGLISAKTESATIVPSEVLVRSQDQTENIATSSSLPVASVTGSEVAPVLSSRDDVVVDDVAKASQSTSIEVKDLIGFDFKPDVIREMHPHVIRGLLDDLPHHCTICGVRVKHQEQFNRHLEWHATREKEQNGLIMASRRWYAKSNDWVSGKSEYPSENEFTDSEDVHDRETDSSQWDTLVLADENQCLCIFCGELFEDVYCQEKDQWMFKGAVYLNNSDSKSEMESRNVGPIVHARCLSENSISDVTNTERD